MPPFHLSTLGELRLTRAGADLLPGRRKDLVLLAYLARHSSRPVPRAELAALFWGDRDEQRARTSLRQALFKLRQTLGEEIEVTADTVRVVNGAVVPDVEAMEADLAAERIEAAVERWGGEFLPGAEEIGTEPLRVWIEVERERLRRRYHAALERLVATAEQRGEWGAAIGWARRWAESDPLGERAHTRLVEALRLADRPDEAAATHAAFAARFRRELDADPSPGFLLLGERPPSNAPAPSLHAAVPPSSALFTPDLVGRASAFGELIAAWETVRTHEATGAESGAVVVLEGEEGIGKTRLCEEFLRWIEVSGGGAFILRSRAYSAEHERPWAAARHLFDSLSRAPGVGGAPEDALAAVSRLVPAIRDRFPRLPDPAQIETLPEEALARVLADVAAEVPVILVLDDFPAADSPTQQLLATLARHPPAGVLLLVTARVGAGSTAAALEPFREIPEVRRITLRPLTLPEVEALLASMLALEVAERHELALQLHVEADGNPFYTIALVSALADAEHLAPDESGVWRVSPGAHGRSLPLPAGVREAVRTRLEHLGGGAREVVGAAAVLGRPIRPALLEAVAGLSAGDFAEAVEELLARRLLREVPSPAHGYEFTHDLIGRVTYELLSPPRRQALHRAALKALSGEPPDNEAAAAAIRFHRERAGLLASSSRWRRRVTLAALFTTLVAAAVAALSVWRGEGTPVIASTAHDGRPSVAVLYLDNLSRDTLDAYLAEGFTEEIASRLGALERLRVKSPRAAQRFRGGGTRLDPVAVGDTLGVDYLVEGSVRRAGVRLRISVRLTNTADGFQLWNQSYDAASTELLDVQDTIAHQIATRVAGQLVPEERLALGRRATDNAQAYDHFIRGNYHLARRTPASVLRAIEDYREAARLDPTFSSALAREAYGYALFLDWGWPFPDAMPEELLARGLLITERVLQRDSASADAWMARAYLFVIRDPLRHAGAVEGFRRSIALHANNAEVHHQLGQTLTALGLWEEARAAYRRVLEIEPGRAMTYVPLAAISLREGHPAQARRLSDSALIGDPSVPYAYASRGLGRINARDAAGARRDAEMALQLDQTYQLPARSVLAAALYRLGDTIAARRELRHAENSLADDARPAPTEMLYLGAAMVVLERRDEALGLIERTRPRSAWLWFYLQDPVFDAIRDHPRFRRIIEQVRPLRDE